VTNGFKTVLQMSALQSGVLLENVCAYVGRTCFR
jgi:hypothetical protein